MEKELDIVDLGTKHGNAISTFFNLVKKKNAIFNNLNFDVDSLNPKLCIGFERPAAENYRSIVEGKGFNFSILDLADPLDIVKLPQGKVNLMWHFLEHLPDKATSKLVLQEALTKTSGMVWCRLPSFEPDLDTGEGVLRKLGLRFTWTHWSGHTSFWLVDDCVKAITEWGEQNPQRKFKLVIKPCEYMRDTNDKRIVPIKAPIDTQVYRPSYGKKPFKVFNPKVVSAWEVVVKFTEMKAITNK